MHNHYSEWYIIVVVLVAELCPGDQIIIIIVPASQCYRMESPTIAGLTRPVLFSTGRPQSKELVQSTLGKRLCSGIIKLLFTVIA